MPLTKMLIPLALVTSLGLAACGGGSSATATTSPPATTSSSAATAAKGSVATVPATSTKAAEASTRAAGQTVSANKASKADISAALTAAGVANADRWAGEVVEYRPYSDAAAGFPSLRKELTKYNPPAGTIDKIIASLTP